MSKIKKEYHVKDLVIDDEYDIIDSELSIMDAAKKMKEIGIPDLVVIEKGSENVLGVIADFDIVQNAVAEGLDPKTTNVKSIMYVITPVSLETPVKEAFSRMRDLHVSVIPVVEDGKLKGVCTIHDCWSYIPDQVPDDIGLIPVENTRIAEFWLASVSSIVAFVLGILFPLIGLFGFFNITQSSLMDLLGIADLRGAAYTFNLFTVEGADLSVNLIDLFSRNGAIWLLIIIDSFLIVIFGLLSVLSIIYSSFGATTSYKITTSPIVRKLLPGLVIIFMVIEWILYAIAFAIAGPSILASVSVDYFGLFISIMSMILILVAINRDYFFRSIEDSKSIVQEGNN
jgi:CBS domain-containing protein